MSGPKVLSAEEIRMREEAEERLRLVQEQFRLCEELKRLSMACEEIQLSLMPLLEKKEAVDMSAKLAEISSSCEKAVDAWKLISESKENRVFRERVAKLKQMIFDDSPVVAKLQKRTHDMRKEQISGMLSMAAQKRQPGREYSGYVIHSREDIPESVLQAETARLHMLIEHAQKRAERIGYDVGTELRNITRDIEASTADCARERYMIYQEIHNTDVTQLQPLIKRLEEAERRFDRLDASLSRELAAYHAVCLEYGIDPELFPFCEESVQRIRYATAGILCTYGPTFNLSEMMERIRISLSAQGYIYLGEKEETRSVWRQVFRIHGNTILHVIYDSTGRVTMEVALEDSCDRPPQQREVQCIVDEQGAFCSSFERIIEGLADAGVYLKKEMMFPVGEEFAQIVNTSEFRRSAEAKAPDYSIYESPSVKYKEMR